jgi:hypothetical protein
MVTHQYLITKTKNLNRFLSTLDPLLRLESYGKARSHIRITLFARPCCSERNVTNIAIQARKIITSNCYTIHTNVIHLSMGSKYIVDALQTYLG